ncbi:hypothetical protein [Bradyrhizobium sp. I1.7.5]|uniref:hypothetical protein n=1 Tax=Bradyrhizobium sp. I1.7.5 TaxID=3156363 RepID=UPI00339661D5
MNPFKKAAVVDEPVEITGTEALRHHLTRRTSGPNGMTFAKIAADVSDTINTAAAEAKAREIATRMAPPDADDMTIRVIANRLLDGLGSTSSIIGGQQLEDFAKARIDLSAEVKNALANFLHGGSVVYDAELDKLRSAYNHVPQKIGPPPASYVNPNPVIAKAQADLKAAMAAARGPAPLMPAPTNPPPSAPRLRPGFV